MIKWLVPILAIGLFCSAFTSSSLTQSGNVHVNWGDDKQGSDGWVYKMKEGPAPRAPKEGYRAKHQYRYYPYCNVYHEPSRGVYFYMKGNEWTVGTSLPTRLQSSSGSYVNLDMDTSKPYEHNAEHLKQYPKEDYKAGKVAKK